MHTSKQALFSSLAISTLAAIICTGCSKPTLPENRRVRTAPMSQNQTGVLVRGMDTQKTLELLEQNPQLNYRELNSAHHLYELFGMNAEELRHLVADDNVEIEPNVFRIDETRKGRFLPDMVMGYSQLNLSASQHPIVTYIEREQGIQLTGPILDFVSTCKIDRVREPLLQVRTDKGFDRLQSGLLMNLGESITVTSQGSQANDGTQNLHFVWIVSGSEYSTVPATAYSGDTFSFAPDAMGPHMFSLVGKDADGVCNLAMAGFYVTANDPYNPSRALDPGFAARLPQELFWHIFHVNAQPAWSISQGHSLMIAVLDTGVDYNHPAITANMAINRGEIPGNNVDDDNNGFVDDLVGYDFGQDDGYPFDDFGHGTHVAGIAASNIFGAARAANILALKVGAGFGMDMGSVAAAILYAVDRNANIINMSMGWETDVQAIRYALQYAEQQDVLLVAASGNGDRIGRGFSIDERPQYPASYPLSNIIAVAASNERDALTSYSNFGQTVHVAAPGGTDQLQIFSALLKNPKGEAADYTGLMGTSMASPLVAGVAAQVWAADTRMSASEVKRILIETSRPSPYLTGRIQSGGVVDAMAALQSLFGPRPQ